MTINAPKVKVSIFSIANNNGVLYAKFDVLYPKTLMREGKIVRISQLGELSKSREFGLVVGADACTKNSFAVKINSTKTWAYGHTGYIDISAMLLYSEEQSIRACLNVDNDWDGDWDAADVLDGLSQIEIKKLLDDYNNDPWIKFYDFMQSSWTELKYTNDFIEKCKAKRVPESTYVEFINDKKSSSCCKCNKENLTVKAFKDGKTYCLACS